MYKINKFHFVVISRWIAILFISHPSFARKDDSSSSLQVQFLPAVFYTPETRLGAGVSIYSFFSLDKNDTITRKSNIQSYVSGTINKQFLFENDYQIWGKKNKQFFSGSIDYTKFPELFFGLGNETKTMNAINISFNLLRMKSYNLNRIYKSLYGGLILHYQCLYNENIDLMSIELTKQIFGAMGYQSLGAGPVLIMDKRDNTLNPARGHYAELSCIKFTSLLNKELPFTSFTFDIRKYATLAKKIVWNSNFHLEMTDGKVPFRMLPELGGARFLRGYYRGRFRDNNAFVFQHELRSTIYKRLGFAIFGGLGQVTPTAKDFLKGVIHYNCGLGLRLKINKKENANVRIDYGFTKDSKGLYIVFAEAF